MPTEMVAEMARSLPYGYGAWARRTPATISPFQLPGEDRRLAPPLCRAFRPYDHIYDPLLDDFEPGLKTADVKGHFQPFLRPQQVELIKAISTAPR
ncbi:MAG: hypothetical protein U5O16_37685 [Rhodococcus sp. (in: high G+C Gram-positive bacteria)]|uniref:hypothetical protein n=1 Tax=Rhodococcus sp. TaxID=1831 RepID=UPI002AD6C745|nr:hypothetical protein [Rhodococcus sp. (in: high G+C Gram-positive bacteria)]